MEMSKLLERINFLAKKKKTVGLTAEEQKEQQILRQEYLKKFRANFRKQIENISIVDEDGNETPVTSKRKKMMDASVIIPGLKAESEYTAEEKQHVSQLSEALATELGNPKKPTGEAGTQMLHRMNESHAPLTDWALSLIEFDAHDTVLDIGCGGGAALRKLSDRVSEGKLFGIDYSDIALEATKAYNIKVIEDGKLEVIKASVSQMPFEDNSFDKIISVESYFFWPDLAADLAEVKRVLKPGGKLLLVSACYDHEDMPKAIADNIKKYEMNCLGIEAFETILNQVGYQAVTIHTKEGEEWIAAEAVK